MHDLIMFWSVGDFPDGYVVDHVNGDGLDNRLENLRYATASQNRFNSVKSRSNTYGYKGVFWHKGAKKWMVQIKFQGNLYYVGLFTSKDEAAKAYNKKALELSSEFANLNEVS